jgi:hypothetical protein
MSIRRVIGRKSDWSRTFFVVFFVLSVLAGSFARFSVAYSQPRPAQVYSVGRLVAQIDALPSSLGESQRRILIAVIHSPLRFSFAAHPRFSVQAGISVRRDNGPVIQESNQKQRQGEIDSHLLDAINPVKANLVCLC